VFGGELAITESAVSFGFITKDPLLTNVDGMFRLSPRSPAKDAGVPIPMVFRGVFEDIEGERRQRPDIGADELSSDQPRRRPLTPNDVGPSWIRGK